MGHVTQNRQGGTCLLSHNLKYQGKNHHVPLLNTLEIIYESKPSTFVLMQDLISTVNTRFGIIQNANMCFQ